MAFHWVNTGDGDRDLRNVTLTALATNITLSIVKLATGLWTGSVALVADAANSISDIGIDASILVAARVSRRPVDHNHAYGHGKYETLTAIVIAAVIMAVGAGFAWRAYAVFRAGPGPIPGVPVIAVAIVTLVSKEWLYRLTRGVSRRVHSATLMANAWNHRSDALSAFVVLLGGAGVLAGWSHADAVAGVFVAAMIFFAGARVAADAATELTDGAAEPDVNDQLQRLIYSHPSVRAHHKLRSRRVGREIFVDVHVLVDPTMNVYESHQVTKELKDLVSRRVKKTVNLLVHIEPDIPGQRTGGEYLPTAHL
ncbi:MAG: cation diffusion facilitator family transporter [Deltaproteobacteria bacterium]|nr:cation diffusion facilitator family transporter [Deltaproteobacteria bacterium]